MRGLVNVILMFICFAFLIGCKSKKAVYYSLKEEQRNILPIQEKYSPIIGVVPEKIEPVQLYEFIDNWIGAPYKMGGETKMGVDCSYFSQILFHKVYGVLIERTAHKQFVANSTDRFIGQSFLKQGDLLFFNQKGSERYEITHVGVYLGYGKFVHSSSNRTETGKNGVQISDFRKSKWQRMFVAAGRKVVSSKTLIQGSN